MPRDPEFIFTFPLDDLGRRDSFMRVTATDEEAARLTVIDHYGQSGWAACYDARKGANVIEKHNLSEIAFGQ